MKAPCQSVTAREARRFYDGCWEQIEDVVSDEQELIIDWYDAAGKSGGQIKLWAWPNDLGALALGHVLLETGPNKSRQCQADVKCLAPMHYHVTLRPACAAAPYASLPPLFGAQLLEAMRAFLTAATHWTGTGCFHQAGLFDPSANALLVRAEDIGRHNCLDRLAGWGAQNVISLQDKVLLTSARITGGYCAKALRAGLSVLVSRSAVTAAAIRLAEEHSATLIGFARSGEERLTLYTDVSGRITPGTRH